MRACLSHVQDAADPKRPGRDPQEVEAARRGGRSHAVGSARSHGGSDCGTTNLRPDASATTKARAGKVADVGRETREKDSRLVVIVLDASAVIELLLNTPRGERVGDLIADIGTTLHAPHLLDVEVLHVLRRLCAKGSIDERRARSALTDLADLPIFRYSHEPLTRRAWALRGALTAYDAIYVALTEVLQAGLVTCDARLAHSSGHKTKTILVN